MVQAPYELGFRTLDHEADIEALPISGQVPPWLRGRLVRTGPAKFEVGADRYRHWFDGLAMLHRFRFGDGKVSYKNRFLGTAAYKDARTERGIRLGEFATPGGFLERLRASLGGHTMSDNGNVSILRFSGKYAALTETPMMATFDPESLSTGASERHPVEIEGQVRTAHPLADSDRGTLYNYIIRFGRKSTYQIYGTDLETGASRVVATLPAPEPSYMHSFAMTAKHVILIESPFVVSPIRLALSSSAFIENYRWKSERPTRFTVVDKDTGQVVARREADPFFFFHTVNAFEAGGVITLDLIAHPNASIVDALYLDRVRDGGGTQPGGGQLRRFQIELGSAQVRVESAHLAPNDRIELPRIDDRCAQRPYRFVWGNGALRDGDFLGTVTKLDLEGGETRSWSEEGVWAGEPIFVPNPRGQAEDDGVLLSLALDVAARRSFLQVLDASSLAPLARCPLPHHVPFGFHGDFFPEDTNEVRS